MLDDLINKALSQRVSDIHFQPYAESYKIRFRVDGQLYERYSLAFSHGEQLVSRIKVLAQLDIAERRRPQDGTFSFDACDIRVATFPSLHGEKVALRLLDRTQRIRELDQLGLSPDQCEIIQRRLCHEQGLFLVTGPTGSGKTTTVHALLSIIASPQIHCVTLEDPIEYTLEGVTQTQVHPEIGLTFEAGLRALLRQDPDCIAVGEIRDQQTAQVAVQAALTGHQVLSTLHTTHAVGAVTRLVTMGIDTYLVAASLKVVISQRLVRTLCTACCTEVQPTHEQRLLLDQWYKPLTKLSFPVGCTLCRGTGYKGRRGVFQVVEITKKMRNRILMGASEDELLESAQKEGMTSLVYEAGCQLEKGLISFNEWRRIVMVECTA